MTGRIRTIKPEWLDDEILAAASDEARVLSVALVLMADDYGRGRGALATIAASAWKYQLERDDGAHAPEVLAKASRALRELSEMRFVTLYEVDRQRYFAIRNWTKHQRVDKPSKPRIPAPPEQETQGNPPPRETPPRPSRDTREDVARPQETLAPDLRPPTSDLDPRPVPPTDAAPAASVRVVPAFVPRTPGQIRDSARAVGMDWPTDARRALMVDIATRYGERYRVLVGATWLSVSAIEAIGRGAPQPSHRGHASHLDAIAEWAEDQRDPLGLVDRVLAHAFADPWMAANKAPLGRIASEPGRYVDPPAPPKPEAAPLAGAAKAVTLVGIEAKARDKAIARARAEALEEPPDLAATLRGIGRALP